MSLRDIVIPSRLFAVFGVFWLATVLVVCPSPQIKGSNPRNPDKKFGDKAFQIGVEHQNWQLANDATATIN
jgi:hypothetical protein